MADTSNRLISAQSTQNSTVISSANNYILSNVSRTLIDLHSDFHMDEYDTVQYKKLRVKLIDKKIASGTKILLDTVDHLLEIMEALKIGPKSLDNYRYAIINDELDKLYKLNSKDEFRGENLLGQYQYKTFNEKLGDVENEIIDIRTSWMQHYEEVLAEIVQICEELIYLLYEIKLNKKLKKLLEKCREFYEYAIRQKCSVSIYLSEEVTNLPSVTTNKEVSARIDLLRKRVNEPVAFSFGNVPQSSDTDKDQAKCSSCCRRSKNKKKEDDEFDDRVYDADNLSNNAGDTGKDDRHIAGKGKAFQSALDQQKQIRKGINPNQQNFNSAEAENFSGSIQKSPGMINRNFPKFSNEQIDSANLTMNLEFTGEKPKKITFDNFHHEKIKNEGIHREQSLRDNAETGKTNNEMKTGKGLAKFQPNNKQENFPKTLSPLSLRNAEKIEKLDTDQNQMDTRRKFQPKQENFQKTAFLQSNENDGKTKESLKRGNSEISQDSFIKEKLKSFSFRRLFDFGKRISKRSIHDSQSKIHDFVELSASSEMVLEQFLSEKSRIKEVGIMLDKSPKMEGIEENIRDSESEAESSDSDELSTSVESSEMKLDKLSPEISRIRKIGIVIDKSPVIDKEFWKSSKISLQGNVDLDGVEAKRLNSKSEHLTTERIKNSEVERKESRQFEKAPTLRDIAKEVWKSSKISPGNVNLDGVGGKSLNSKSEHLTTERIKNSEVERQRSRQFEKAPTLRDIAKEIWKIGKSPGNVDLDAVGAKDLDSKSEHLTAERITNQEIDRQGNRKVGTKPRLRDIVEEIRKNKEISPKNVVLDAKSASTKSLETKSKQVSAERFRISEIDKTQDIYETSQISPKVNDPGHIAAKLDSNDLAKSKKTGRKSELKDMEQQEPRISDGFVDDTMSEYLSEVFSRTSTEPKSFWGSSIIATSTSKTTTLESMSQTSTHSLAIDQALFGAQQESDARRFADNTRSQYLSDVLPQISADTKAKLYLGRSTNVTTSDTATHGLASDMEKHQEGDDMDQIISVRFMDDTQDEYVSPTVITQPSTGGLAQDKAVSRPHQQEGEYPKEQKISVRSVDETQDEYVSPTVITQPSTECLAPDKAVSRPQQQEDEYPKEQKISVRSMDDTQDEYVSPTVTTQPSTECLAPDKAVSRPQQQEGEYPKEQKISVRSLDDAQNEYISTTVFAQPSTEGLASDKAVSRPQQQEGEYPKGQKVSARFMDDTQDEYVSDTLSYKSARKLSSFTQPSTHSLAEQEVDAIEPRISDGFADNDASEYLSKVFSQTSAETKTKSYLGRSETATLISFKQPSLHSFTPDQEVLEDAEKLFDKDTLSEIINKSRMTLNKHDQQPYGCSKDIVSNKSLLESLNTEELEVHKVLSIISLNINQNQVTTSVEILGPISLTKAMVRNEENQGTLKQEISQVAEIPNVEDILMPFSNQEKIPLKSLSLTTEASERKITKSKASMQDQQMESSSGYRKKFEETIKTELDAFEGPSGFETVDSLKQDVKEMASEKDQNDILRFPSIHLESVDSSVEAGRKEIVDENARKSLFETIATFFSRMVNKPSTLTGKHEESVRSIMSGNKSFSHDRDEADLRNKVDISERLEDMSLPGETSVDVMNDGSTKQGITVSGTEDLDGNLTAKREDPNKTLLLGKSTEDNVESEGTLGSSDARDESVPIDSSLDVIRISSEKQGINVSGTEELDGNLTAEREDPNKTLLLGKSTEENVEIEGTLGSSDARDESMPTDSSLDVIRISSEKQGINVSGTEDLDGNLTAEREDPNKTLLLGKSTEDNVELEGTLGSSDARDESVSKNSSLDVMRISSEKQAMTVSGTGVLAGNESTARKDPNKTLLLRKSTEDNAEIESTLGSSGARDESMPIDSLLQTESRSIQTVLSDFSDERRSIGRVFGGSFSTIREPLLWKVRERHKDRLRKTTDSRITNKTLTQEEASEGNVEQGSGYDRTEEAQTSSSEPVRHNEVEERNDGGSTEPKDKNPEQTDKHNASDDENID